MLCKILRYFLQIFVIYQNIILVIRLFYCNKKLCLNTKSYLISTTTGTCEDNIQNHDETAIDCGGICGNSTNSNGDCGKYVKY